MDTGNKPHKNSIAFINDKSPLIDIICNDLVASGIEVRFRSENIENGLSQLSALQELPKTAIIDLDFYDGNVLEQLRELKAKYPSIRLIAHSDIDDEETAKALSDIGVESYLLIGSDADDFKKVIEKV
ncbi:histidine kinase [Elizabethkingia anophelis]|nr:histidine kinase [Elizabethkingia anophelis]